MKRRTAIAALFAVLVPAEAWAGPAEPSGAGGASDFARVLLRSDSATAVLQQICSQRGAERIKAIPRANAPVDQAPGWVRAALAPGLGEAIQYRRVELDCGSEVMSRADNWYLPARLTPGMNQTLLTTQTPFGTAVRAMGFHRRVLSVARPQGAGQGILRVRAVLTASGHPFSVVQEDYSPAVLPR